jgi:hypothetical protein
MVTLIVGGVVAAGESGAIGGNERIVGTIASTPDRLTVLCSRGSGTTAGFEAADSCEGRVSS